MSVPLGTPILSAGICYKKAQKLAKLSAFLACDAPSVLGQGDNNYEVAAAEGAQERKLRII
jgi:hypothetical protein